jgi:CBS domain-containing protein
MGLLRITRTPLVTVHGRSSVMDAVRAMHHEHIGAVAVVDDNTLIGIFSERDLMNRVVLEQLDPERVRVSDVMTSPVITVHRSATADDALKLMDEKHIRHLPVINSDGKLAGMVSVRSLLHEKVQDLTDQLDSLEAYFSADGAGGD